MPVYSSTLELDVDVNGDAFKKKMMSAFKAAVDGEVFKVPLGVDTTKADKAIEALRKADITTSAKVVIDIDRTAFNKHLDALKSYSSKSASEIGRSFSANIKSGLGELSLEDMIKQGGFAKTVSKKGVEGLLEDIGGQIDKIGKIKPSSSYEDIVKLAELYERLGFVIDEVRKKHAGIYDKLDTQTIGSRLRDKSIFKDDVLKYLQDPEKQNRYISELQESYQGISDKLREVFSGISGGAASFAETAEQQVSAAVENINQKIKEAEGKLEEAQGRLDRLREGFKIGASDHSGYRSLDLSFLRGEILKKYDDFMKKWYSEEGMNPEEEQQRAQEILNYIKTYETLGGKLNREMFERNGITLKEAEERLDSLKSDIEMWTGKIDNEDNPGLGLTGKVLNDLVRPGNPADIVNAQRELKKQRDAVEELKKERDRIIAEEAKAAGDKQSEPTSTSADTAQTKESADAKRDEASAAREDAEAQRELNEEKEKAKKTPKILQGTDEEFNAGLAKKNVADLVEMLKELSGLEGGEERLKAVKTAITDLVKSSVDLGDKEPVLDKILSGASDASINETLGKLAELQKTLKLAQEEGKKVEAEKPLNIIADNAINSNEVRDMLNAYKTISELGGDGAEEQMKRISKAILEIVDAEKQLDENKIKQFNDYLNNLVDPKNKNNKNIVNSTLLGIKGLTRKKADETATGEAEKQAESSKASGDASEKAAASSEKAADASDKQATAAEHAAEAETKAAEASEKSAEAAAHAADEKEKSAKASEQASATTATEAQTATEEKQAQTAEKVAEAEEKRKKATEEANAAASSGTTGAGAGTGATIEDLSRMEQLVVDLGQDLKNIATALGSLDDTGGTTNIIQQFVQLAEEVSAVVLSIRQLSETIRGIDFSKMKIDANFENVFGQIQQLLGAFDKVEQTGATNAQKVEPPVTDDMVAESEKNFNTLNELIETYLKNLEKMKNADYRIAGSPAEGEVSSLIHSSDLRKGIPTKTSIKRYLEQYLRYRDDPMGNYADDKDGQEFLMNYSLKQLSAYVALYGDLDEAAKLFGKTNADVFELVKQKIEEAKIALDSYKENDAIESKILNTGLRKNGVEKITFGQADELFKAIESGGLEGFAQKVEELFGVKIPTSIEQARESVSKISSELNTAPNGEQIINQTEIDSISSEMNALDGLTRKIGTIKEAVEQKTQAFVTEGETVRSTVAAEEVNLERLRQKLQSVKAILKEIQNLNSASGGQQPAFLSSLADLLNKTGELENLAKILSESKEKIQEATDAANKTAGKKTPSMFGEELEKFTPQSAGWNDFLGLLDRVKIKLEDVDEIYRSVRRDADGTTLYESFNVTTKDGVTKTIGRDTDGALNVREVTANIGKVQREYDKLISRLKNVKSMEDFDAITGKIDNAIAKFDEFVAAGLRSQDAVDNMKKSYEELKTSVSGKILEKDEVDGFKAATKIYYEAQKALQTGGKTSYSQQEIENAEKVINAFKTKYELVTDKSKQVQNALDEEARKQRDLNNAVDDYNEKQRKKEREMVDQAWRGNEEFDRKKEKEKTDQLAKFDKAQAKYKGLVSKLEKAESFREMDNISTQIEEAAKAFDVFVQKGIKTQDEIDAITQSYTNMKKVVNERLTAEAFRKNEQMDAKNQADFDKAVNAYKDALDKMKGAKDEKQFDGFVKGLDAAIDKLKEFAKQGIKTQDEIDQITKGAGLAQIQTKQRLANETAQREAQKQQEEADKKARADAKEQEKKDIEDYEAAMDKYYKIKNRTETGKETLTSDLEKQLNDAKDIMDVFKQMYQTRADKSKEVQAALDKEIQKQKDLENAIQQTNIKQKERETQKKETSIRTQMKSLDTQLFNAENAQGKTSDFYKRIADARAEYKALQDEIDGMDWNGLSEEQLKDLNERIETIKANIKQLNGKGFVLAPDDKVESLKSRMTMWMSQNTSAKEWFPQINQMIQSLNGEVSQEALEQISAGFHKIGQEAASAGKMGKSFTDTLMGSFRNLARYMLSFASFYRVIGVFKQAVNIIHELDDALVEVQKVSSASADTLQKWQMSTFDQASKVGGDALQIEKSTASWLRLGKSFEGAQEAAQASVKLLNTTEFTNIDDATSSLLSITQAYKELTYEDVIDKLNNVGDHFSSSSSDLAKGLQNAAAVLRTQGNDVDKALALLTAGKSLPELCENINYRMYLTALIA